MENSVYEINKGVNKCITFRGLKAQYVWYLGGGICALLLLFSAMYIIGVPSYMCVAVILLAGSLLIYKVYGMSNKYGEHGLTKHLARRWMPKVVKLYNRRLFIHLNSNRSTTKERKGRYNGTAKL